MAANRYNRYSLFGVVLVVGLLVAAPRWGVAVEIPDEDVQILASGPVHEAFAEAVTLDPEVGLWSPEAPPALIEEIPPAEKPEGNVQWIPGYWAWDDDKNDFIWVSGIWRVAPPDRQWIPGYWTPGPDGYQWVSGYWAGVEEVETEYLPEPPASVEIGPNSNAPSSNYVWIPGCWEWYYGRYAWRPGYWAKAQADWMWVPAHYVWTPRGHIFVRGYWDYTVIRRGVLFAPVYFTPRVSIGFRYWFSPGFVIDLNIFDDALFLRPRYHHYYFGDYYAPKYYKRGIYPWFSLHARRMGYDPIYAHQRWQHRHDGDWENRLQKNFQDRRNHEDKRPSRYFDAHRGPDPSRKSPGHQRPNFVNPIDHGGKAKTGPSRFQPLNETERREFSNREKEVRVYRTERQHRETPKQEIPRQTAVKKTAPNKEKFRKSPIMDRTDQRTKWKRTPPRQYKTPKPNPHVEPLEKGYERSRGGQRQPKKEEIKKQPENSGHPQMNKDRESGDKESRSENRTNKTRDDQKKEKNSSKNWSRRN